MNVTTFTFVTVKIKDNINRLEVIDHPSRRKVDGGNYICAGAEDTNKRSHVLCFDVWYRIKCICADPGTLKVGVYCSFKGYNNNVPATVW